MSMATFTPTLSAERIADLSMDIQTTPYVYTLVRHVSRSGMQRRISVFIVRNGEITDVSVAVAQITGHKVNDADHGIVVSGAGMDMAWYLVYTLSRKLYADHPTIKSHAGGGDPGYILTHRGL